MGWAIVARFEAPVVEVQQPAREESAEDAADAVGEEAQADLDFSQGVGGLEEGGEGGQDHLPDHVVDAYEEDGEGSLQLEEDADGAEDVEFGFGGGGIWPVAGGTDEGFFRQAPALEGG